MVQVAGLILAGQIDTLGISPVLGLQAVGLVLAGLMMMRIAPVQPAVQRLLTGASSVQVIRDGLVATYRSPIIFHTLLITFSSSIFNAGSFITVFPFIVKRIYDGDAWLLAVLMAVFFAGATLSNLILLRYMPLKAPGRLVFDYAVVADCGDLPDVDRAGFLGDGGGHHRLGFEHGRDHQPGPGHCSGVSAQ